MTTTLYLVRHGQSAWNLRGLLQGQTPDVPLTGLGREQARAAAAGLAGVAADALYSSDLLRARQTARPIARALGLPVRVDARLREQGHGTLEGLPTRELLDAPPYDFADPDAHAPGGESTREVYRRMGEVLDACLRRHAGGRVVLVGHGDAIRIGLGLLDGHPADRLPWRAIGNGSVSVFRTGAGGGSGVVPGGGSGVVPEGGSGVVPEGGSVAVAEGGSAGVPEGGEPVG